MGKSSNMILKFNIVNVLANVRYRQNGIRSTGW